MSQPVQEHNIHRHTVTSLPSQTLRTHNNYYCPVIYGTTRNQCNLIYFTIFIYCIYVYTSWTVYKLYFCFIFCQLAKMCWNCINDKLHLCTCHVNSPPSSILRNGPQLAFLTVEKSIPHSTNSFRRIITSECTSRRFTTPVRFPVSSDLCWQ